MTRADLRECIEAIEKSYEFFLAYAAQGAKDEAASKVGAQLRDFLGQMEGALAALRDDLGSIVKAESLEPADRYRDMVEIATADAGRALAAVRIVAAQGVISSELIDNLNASIHLRVLLTDLFLLDEVV